MIYAVDIYTGQSILARAFDTISEVCEFLFEIDVTDYSTINICKYEDEYKTPCDFTGVRIDADCVRTGGESEGQGY